MKHLFVRSLFLAFVASSFTVLNAQPKPQDKKVAPFRGSGRYNAIHAVTTAGSYTGALVLTTTFKLMGAFMAFGDKAPYMAIAMKYGGIAAGAVLLCATPYFTNQALYQQNYLTKEEAMYTQNQLLVHSAIRLAAFALMYKYSSASINATKDSLFKLRNG